MITFSHLSPYITDRSFIIIQLFSVNKLYSWIITFMLVGKRIFLLFHSSYLNCDAIMTSLLECKN